MPTIAELIAPISDATYGQPDLVRDAIEALQRGGHIGESGAEATAGDAARLLVALMATDIPVNACCAVERFAALPARWVSIEYLPGECERVSAEEVPMPAASVSDWRAITNSFIAALAYFLKISMSRGIQPEAALSRIRLRRTLGRPAAKLGLALPDGVNVDLVYTMDDAVPRFDRGGSAMLVMTEMPASALWRLAGFLGGWHPSPERQPVPAPHH